MDSETLNKIGGKVKWLEVPYTTTKLSVETGKNKWQTAGGDTIIARVDIGSEADPDAVLRATREWLKEKAVEANKVTMDKLLVLYKAYHEPGVAPAKPPVAKKPPVAQDAQQPQQSGLLDDTAKTFVVETLSVEVKGGKRYVKAKGGPFVMYGVNVWEEIRKLPPLEWDEDYVNGLEGAEYSAPTGLTAIYVEKTLDSGKVVPDKVTGWA